MALSTQGEVSSSDIIVDLRRGEAFEWGAMLLTLMAFPEEDASESRSLSCFHSLCNLAIRRWAEHDPARAWRMVESKLEYAFADPAVVNRDLRKLEKRLKRCMVAGKMCIPFLHEAFTGRKPELPEGIKGLSISQMSVMVLGDSGQKDPKNVPTRIWHPSHPVVHLAAAVAIVSSALVHQDRKPLSFASILVDPVAIALIVRTAEEVVPLLACSRAGVDVDALVGVRLAT